MTARAVQFNSTMIPTALNPPTTSQLRRQKSFHQNMAQAANATDYQHQQIYAHQQQYPQVTRAIHINRCPSLEQVSAPPVRQFVTFKNLRHLNQPGAQWEHCEHITIALSPDEMERKIRRHDIPGNDLVHCLSKMGVYRQKHVQKYEDKINAREPDPMNWMWVLEALGEVRDKKKATPHTFWAIFQRTSRNHPSQHSRYISAPQPPPVMIHQPPQSIEIPHAPALPPTHEPLTITGPPPPQRVYHTQTQYGAAVVQPARTIKRASSTTYNHSQPHQQIYSSSAPSQQMHYSSSPARAQPAPPPAPPAPSPPKQEYTRPVQEYTRPIPKPHTYTIDPHHYRTRTPSPGKHYDSDSGSSSTSDGYRYRRSAPAPPQRQYTTHRSRGKYDVEVKVKPTQAAPRYVREYDSESDESGGEGGSRSSRVRFGDYIAYDKRGREWRGKEGLVSYGKGGY